MFTKRLTVLLKQDGFTLLEIMLVLLLIGMVSVGVVMTLPNSSASAEDPYWQAQRFRTLVEFAEDEALISGLELGVVFNKNSYQFAFYDYKSKKWLAMVDKQIQAKVVLPSTLRMEYLLSDLLWNEIEKVKQDEFIEQDELVNIEGEDKSISLNPQVYLMASGEVTPFSVEFSVAENSSEKRSVTVSVDMGGTVTLSELKND